MNNTEETLDFEQKHKEDLQRLRGFRLLDDDFMSKVLKIRHVLNFYFKSFCKGMTLKYSLCRDNMI